MEVNTSKIRILVVGANGQLGSELRVIALTQNVLDFIFSDIDELDITQALAVNKALGLHKPHFVVNCAAYTAVDRAEEEGELAFKLNSEAPRLLASACKQVGAKLIHVSTDYVFNGNSCEPYTEESITSPTSVYGESKLEGEKAVIASGAGMVIRTSWLYSSFGNNFVKTIASKVSKGEILSVVYDQVGTPTWARDLARAIVTIIGQAPEKFKAEIFNFSNEGVCSWYDVAKDISAYLNANCQIFPILSCEYKTLATRPHYSVLSKSKIKGAFPVEVPYWRDSLYSCLKDIKG